MQLASRSPVQRSDFPLSDDQIHRVDPSIFAEAPHESRTPKNGTHSAPLQDRMMQEKRTVRRYEDKNHILTEKNHDNFPA